MKLIRMILRCIFGLGIAIAVRTYMMQFMGVDIPWGMDIIPFLMIGSGANGWTD